MEDRLSRIFQFKEQMFAPLAGILMAPPRFLIMRSEVMIFAQLVGILRVVHLSRISRFEALMFALPEGILMVARRFHGTSWASTPHKAHH